MTTVLTDEWTQDSAWYNALPIFKKYGIKLPSRKYFKSLIKAACEKLGVTREQLGIVAARGPQCILVAIGLVLVSML